MDANVSWASFSYGEDVLASKLPLSWKSVIGFGVVGYLSLCSALRFQRVRRMQSRLKFTDRRSLSRMTVENAQEILKASINLDCPLIYDFSLRLALIKTYAVDNVAKVLVSVSDLNKPGEAAKRYEDTAILYKCFAAFEPHSDEFLKAIARMNYLHSPYIKSGKILNEDFLYVLYASMAEPVRFIRQYEWRELTDMEVAALGTLWKHVGDLMGIDWAKEVGHSEWRDGLHFMEEISAWGDRYEIEHLKPTKDANRLGIVLWDLLLSSYPSFMRPAGYQISLVVLGDRLRHAFGFPEPNLGWTTLTYNLLFVRRLFMRYLSLPRVFPTKFFSKPDPETGRMNQYSYLKEPWYVPKTIWSRWGLDALFTRLAGGKLPGDDGAKWMPNGFIFEEIGPQKTMGKGVDETNALADPLRRKSSVPANPFWSQTATRA